MHEQIIDYSIRDIINYRTLPWSVSDDFFFLTCLPEQVEPFFVSPTYYCFGMITEGSLDININGQDYLVSPDHFMIYRPGQTFKAGGIAPGTKGNFVLFTKKFLDYLNENIFSIQSYSFLSRGISPVISLRKADKKQLSKTFSSIFDLLQQLSHPHPEPVARNLVSVLSYETDHILKSYLDTAGLVPETDADIMGRFSNLVVRHFKTQRKPCYYAKSLGVSTRYLYNAVKRLSGRTPSELINHRIISEAGNLIRHTAKNFSEIAYTLNFNDPFTFSKYFKKHAGCSPSAFRKREDTLLLLREN